MKIIITESQLKTVVFQNDINMSFQNINESQIKKLFENSAKESLIDTIKDEGFKSASELVGGNKNLLKLLKINTPEQFLNIYNDLDVVQSKEEENVTLFRYKKGYNLMYYDRKTRYVDINYNDIWLVLSNTFGLNSNDIRALIKRWLETTYNLKGTTPIFMK